MFVLQVTGGCNVHSNKACEEWYKERQKARRNNDNTNSSSSGIWSAESSSSSNLTFEENKNKFIQMSNQKRKKRLEGLKLSSNIDSLSDESESEERSEEAMRAERLCRMYESKDDDEVYVHPLFNEIKKDKVWQAHNLQRKGKKELLTPRTFYMNVKDTNFEFKTNHEK